MLITINFFIAFFIAQQERVLYNYNYRQLEVDPATFRQLAMLVL